MKKLTILILAFCSVIIFSCEEEEENDRNEEIKSFIVPEDYTSIQSAIDASVEGDTIFVLPGTYKENINFNGKEIIVSSTEPDNPDIVETTIIDGGNKGTVVTFNSSETSSVLDGFTITNGDAGTSNGGGILIANASNPVVKNCIINNNTAQYGAGICVSDQSQPVIENNIFTSNTADGSRGAGIYAIKKSSVTINDNIFKDHTEANGVIHIGSTSTDESSAEISNNLIENNTTEFGTGGIMVTAVSTADIYNNTIKNNTGSGDNFAGGITVSKNSYADISNNTITDNSAKQNGAVVIYDESEAVISGNNISGNSAGSEQDTKYGTGGAISVSSSSKADISNNTISENHAWSLNHGGGGIIISYSSEAIIDNNEIMDNKAYRFGGGIYVRQNSNYVTITNNVISGNEADGYGASNGGGAYLRNIVKAVVYNNSITNNYAQYRGGGIYVYNNVDILECDLEETWTRNNYPPVENSYNEYINNTQGDYPDDGAHVYFSD